MAINTVQNTLSIIPRTTIKKASKGVKDVSLLSTTWGAREYDIPVHNTLAGAVSPKARVWRKKSEGLQITAKGSKDLAGGKRLHMMVAIAYGKELYRQSYEKLNGQFFADFIKQHFNVTFARAGPKNNRKRLFVMDNDPSQNSRVARAALEQVECELVSIPARSPDLNPMENIFHIVKSELEKNAIELNAKTPKICSNWQRLQDKILGSMINNKRPEFTRQECLESILRDITPR